MSRFLLKSLRRNLLTQICVLFYDTVSLVNAGVCPFASLVMLKPSGWGQSRTAYSPAALSAESAHVAYLLLPRAWKCE